MSASGLSDADYIKFQREDLLHNYQLELEPQQRLSLSTQLTNVTSESLKEVVLPLVTQSLLGSSQTTTLAADGSSISTRTLIQSHWVW